MLWLESMMSMKKYNIAILGATGLVGTTFLKVLEEYDFPIDELKLFASSKSLGKQLMFNGQTYDVLTVSKGSFKGIDFALFSAGANVSRSIAHQAVSEGAIVIDNSSAFRMEKSVPLVVPEVNIRDAYNQKLIANPNCSTIQCVLPLSALDKHFNVLQVEYNTYQAVSGSGFKGLQSLSSNANGFYPYDINETCIPQIDEFEDDGYTKEEHKMMEETKKILHKENLKVTATCVRVPVEYGHGVSIRVKLANFISLEEVKKVLSAQAGIVVLDDPKNNIYPTSIQATNTDSVYVGRIRRDTIDKNTILLYCVADNVRKGAASNAIQIMEGLIKHENSL
jgi:aspartate-semialdehyde dehydrogenase